MNFILLISSHAHSHDILLLADFQMQIRLDTRVANTKFSSMSPEVRQQLTGLLQCSESSVLNTAKTLRFIWCVCVLCVCGVCCVLCVCVCVCVSVHPSGSQVAIVTPEQWRKCKQAVSDEHNRLRSSESINHHQRCCLLLEVSHGVRDILGYIDSDRPWPSSGQW